MQFIKTYLFCYILWKEILAENSTITIEDPITTNYFDDLVNYLNESKLHQVVFIHEDKFANMNPMMNSLLKAVNTNFPSFNIDYNEVENLFERFTNDRFKKEVHFRRTTLFVFQLRNENSMHQIIKSLIQINRRTVLAFPRYLIMNSYNSTHQYLNSTLHFFGENRYLDITIMTYNQNHQVTPFLSQLNLFTKNFTNQKIFSGIQWFPNKINNLNGFKMMTPIYYENHHNNEKLKERMENIFTSIFAQAMNFKDSNISPQHGWLYYKSKMEFNDIPYDGELFLPFRLQNIDGTKAVIPRTEKFINVFHFSPGLLHMILGTIGTILVIRIVAFFMKFKRTTWQTFNISQIIMGLPANNEPTYSLERIVYGSLLIACIVYTGYFYSVILDINLQSEPEISSLEELANSAFRPMMSLNVYLNIRESSIYHIRKLSKIAITKRSSEEVFAKYCLNYLAKYNNVSCIIQNAEYYINKYSVFEGKELNVKILPQIVNYYGDIWESTNNSPLTDRYNEVIQEISEFGLFKDEYQTSYVSPQKISPPDLIKKDKIFFLASYVLGIGYSLSIITFLLEMFTTMLSVRMHTFYTSFRLGN